MKKKAQTYPSATLVPGKWIVKKPLASCFVEWNGTQNILPKGTVLDLSPSVSGNSFVGMAATGGIVVMVTQAIAMEFLERGEW